MPKSKPISLLAGSVAAAALLSACGGGNGSPTTTSIAPAKQTPKAT